MCHYENSRNEKHRFRRLMSVSLLVVLLLGVILTAATAYADGEEDDEPLYGSLQELAGKRIGVQMGTVFDETAQENIPDAQILYFNNFPDEVTAIGANKIDGIPTLRMVFSQFRKEDSRFAIIDEPIGTLPLAYLFPKNEKGKKLQGEMNEFLAVMRENGELERLEEMWSGIDESLKPMDDYRELPDINGTLNFLTEGSFPPFNYVRGDLVVGYDVDIAARFCKEYGYALNVQPMDFSALMPAVYSGKCDFAASGIAVTEERAKNAYFSDPNIEEKIVVMVMKKSVANDSKTFFRSIAESFRSTFINENRYRLFLQGIGMTLCISVLSVIFGTALGFGIYMWCRKGSRIAEVVTGFFVWLIQGLPVVVLLMLLYYVIFGKVSINGMWVAVIGFSMTFGAAVFGMLRSGVGAIDAGQTEAAYALGFSDRQTFFGVVLPQAAQVFLPSYKSEIVSLIKATAIVGYIAVQDLTKMGDIVRSRTYEAFFPLIAVAVIYFVLAGLLTFIVNKITLPVYPKRRRKEQILKGIDTGEEVTGK